jgi:hypothetical protein
MKIKAAFNLLKNYIDTYTEQHCWESYSKEIWINDILYGLGLSLGTKKHEANTRDNGTEENVYRFANGFNKFKLELIEMFDKEGLIDKYLKEKEDKS